MRRGLKTFLTIGLLLIVLSARGQYKEPLIALGLMTSSIVLDAIGDGYNDSGNKVLGHALNAGSVGLLVASPFVINTKYWGWYFASYIGLRIALFDPCYNLSRGLPLGYVGNSSLWDKALQKQNPKWLLAGRSLVLVVSITIPIREL